MTTLSLLPSQCTHLNSVPTLTDFCSECTSRRHTIKSALLCAYCKAQGGWEKSKVFSHRIGNQQRLAFVQARILPKNGVSYDGFF
ncbi:hypothetical protein POVWA2_019380 [Plasmodium ovale wallikeri]|uniref:Uncharacterized protein n=1 Tax=Plasmodium ovale wallikeri TaxID=864142 RepID=A0A1A8YQJ9_PLAOA|nr:hypothetical protein POVWA1_019070 [Plasmodium ovale wallikeri]SBT34340.1 hypothetical protein POVWA2_019380 [Plasmodium ovale wallikeri]